MVPSDLHVWGDGLPGIYDVDQSVSLNCHMQTWCVAWCQVIFMFGEIDCREGLTMAVDKLKYETVDAAMDVLLHIYKGAAMLLGMHNSPLVS